MYANLGLTATLVCALTMPVSLYAASDVSDKLSNASAKVDKVVNDTAITTKIKSLLVLESDIKSFKIGVTTNNGVVSLDGSVDTGLQADKAIQIAQSVTGVKDVDNAKLVVKSSDSYTTDALTTAKVKGTIMQLANDNKISAGSDLHVETTNGAVHVFGTVAKSADSSVVKDAASAVSGVKSVNTNIDVKS